MPLQFSEMPNAEKDFLHSLSSQTGAALLAADFLLSEIEADPERDKDQLMFAQKTLESLRNIEKMIHARREELIRSKE